MMGLLTGVSSERRNPLNPMESNLTPDQQYMAMGAKNVGVMQAGLRDLTGQKSLEEKKLELKTKIAGLNPIIPADAKKLIKYYTLTGDRVEAARVANTLEKAQEKKALAAEKEKIKVATVAQLNELGLTEQAEAFNVGSITQAQAGSIIASAIAAKSLPDYSNLDLTDPEAVKKALLEKNQIAGAISIQQEQQRVQEEKQQRTTMIARAQQMGRLDIVAHLESNGDLDKAETALLKTQTAKVSNLTANDRKEYDSHWKQIDEKKQQLSGVLEKGMVWGFNINAHQKFRIELEAENLYTNNPALGRLGALNLVLTQRLGLQVQPVILPNEDDDDPTPKSTGTLGQDAYGTITPNDED